MGVLPAAPDAIAAALAAGRDVALWPGGEVDSLRPWTKRDKAVLAGRKGFIKLAIITGVPIVPIATVGGPDSMPVITSGRRLAKALQLDKIARIKIMPISLSAPWGLSPGDAAGDPAADEDPHRVPGADRGRLRPGAHEGRRLHRGEVRGGARSRSRAAWTRWPGAAASRSSAEPSGPGRPAPYSGFMFRACAGLATCAAALALAAAGCGGDDGGGGNEPTAVAPARFADLLARLPAGEREAIALDVAGARRELGLPADAAPPAPPAHGTDGGRRLRGLVAATVLNYPIKDNGPLDRAVDYRRVTGLARVDGPPEVLLIATREPWDELKKALERGGWRERRDGVMERPAGPELRWVAGRDGFVVAAGDPSVPRAVLQGRTHTAPPLRALLTAADGPARAARMADPGSRCVRGFGASYSPAAAGGRFLVAVDAVPALAFRLKAGSRPLPARRLRDADAAGRRRARRRAVHVRGIDRPGRAAGVAGPRIVALLRLPLLTGALVS